MIKGFVLLALVICFLLPPTYCKIGVLPGTLQTTTLKCLVIQGITNFGYATEFPP